jgi:hypothetical protein
MARGYKNMRFEWQYSQGQIIEDLGFGKRLNRSAAIIFKRYCNPYVPYKDGRLSTDVSIETDSNSAYIRYNAPYAQAQYYGTGEYVTHANNPMDWQRTLDTHIDATSFWDKEAWLMHKREITKEVDVKRAKYVARRKKS